MGCQASSDASKPKAPATIAVSTADSQPAASDSNTDKSSTNVQDAATIKPLYERLGGAAAINAVVEGMYVKIFSDPDLTDFFRKTDKDRQKAMQVKFLTMATGGPSEYSGKSMAEAHKGRGIQSKDFDSVCGHVVSTMKELGVSEALINETAGLLLPLRADCCQA